MNPKKVINTKPQMLLLELNPEQSFNTKATLMCFFQCSILSRALRCEYFTAFKCEIFLHTHASEIRHLNQLVNLNNTIRIILPMHLTQLENCFMEHLDAFQCLAFKSTEKRQNIRTFAEDALFLDTCMTVLCFGQCLVG